MSIRLLFALVWVFVFGYASLDSVNKMLENSNVWGMIDLVGLFILGFVVMLTLVGSMITDLKAQKIPNVDIFVNRVLAEFLVIVYFFSMSAALAQRWIAEGKVRNYLFFLASIFLSFLGKALWRAKRSKKLPVAAKPAPGKRFQLRNIFKRFAILLKTTNWANKLEGEIFKFVDLPAFLSVSLAIIILVGVVDNFGKQAIGESGHLHAEEIFVSGVSCSHIIVSILVVFILNIHQKTEKGQKT